MFGFVFRDPAHWESVHLGWKWDQLAGWETGARFVGSLSEDGWSLPATPVAALRAKPPRGFPKTLPAGLKPPAKNRLLGRSIWNSGRGRNQDCRLGERASAWLEWRRSITNLWIGSNGVYRMKI